MLGARMSGQRTGALRQKHLSAISEERPYFVEEEAWRVFLAYVRDGQTIREISQGTGLSTFKIGLLLARVDRELEIPRPGDLKRAVLTLDSPIEDLALSGRARNALHEAGCTTIRDLLENDFSRAIRRLGPITREEISVALHEHGFGAPAKLSGERDERIADLVREIDRLRTSIETESRHWQSRVERLERRLRKLTSGERSSAAG
jgi:hypothetical protein